MIKGSDNIHEALEKLAAPIPRPVNPSSFIAKKLRAQGADAARLGMTSAARSVWKPAALRKLEARVMGEAKRRGINTQGIRMGDLGRQLRRITGK